MPLVRNVRGEAGNQGNLRPADRDGAARAAAAWSKKAAEHAATHLPVIREMRAGGMTFKKTAWEDDSEGFHDGARRSLDGGPSVSGVEAVSHGRMSFNPGGTGRGLSRYLWHI